jgi:AraC-like DNA-binding protein
LRNGEIPSQEAPVSPRLLDRHTLEPHRATVERVIQAMRKRPAIPLTLNEMAALGVMSPFHFNRVFHFVTGIPPGLFQSALRLEAAKKLLLTTAMHQAEICEELGFLSLATFARQFKAKVGVSPEHLRDLATMIRESFHQLDELLPVFPEAQRHPGGAVGEVTAPLGFDGLVVVALFRKAFPEGWPAGCAMRAGIGPFELPRLPDGSYHLLAAGVDRQADIAASLADGDQILRTSARGLKIQFSDGKMLGLPNQGIKLRQADPLDPPILFAFPALILELLRDSNDNGLLVKD